MGPFDSIGAQGHLCWNYWSFVTYVLAFTLTALQEVRGMVVLAQD